MLLQEAWLPRKQSRITLLCGLHSGLFWFFFCLFYHLPSEEVYRVCALLRGKVRKKSKTPNSSQRQQQKAEVYCVGWFCFLFYFFCFCNRICTSSLLLLCVLRTVSWTVLESCITDHTRHRCSVECLKARRDCVSVSHEKFNPASNKDVSNSLYIFFQFYS